MKSQPNAKAGMYTLNEDFDMKAEIVAMERRLEELEMWKIQKVHTIFEKPVQAIPCSICLSYEHLVEECPTIPAQASNLEQAIVNLTKVVGDFVAAQKSINDQFRQENAQIRQEIANRDRKMDEMQNDLSEKIENL
ncbi:hypothetical protein CK203_027231 [Vitis vinifera]|uniref:Uncharacterized protein n=1 Tax=Vitis vinifera TaxID=29760 RepID=A0A438J9K2_VITVI|nr:hypothetical protein CK203_027231 [Vitis vinifera]